MTSNVLTRFERAPHAGSVDHEICPICGGDGRIETAHQETKCPSCHGSGRRAEHTGFRDVTKTKPEHHHPAAKKRGEKQTWPSTFEGRQLADEVKACHLSDSEKARLTQSIIDYENNKGSCTKTFSRLIRKQIRLPT